MKINNMMSSATQPSSGVETAEQAEKNGSYFAADLLRRQDELSIEKLNQLMEKVTENGKRLGLNPTYAELKSYRESVRNFLGEVVSRAYTLESSKSWSRQGRRKVYSVIKEVDSKLAELAEDVRHGQSRQLNIMAKLDSIRGMLIDLYS